LCWTLFTFPISWSHTVGILGQGISPSQCRITQTENKHTDIHALSGIWTNGRKQFIP
jgi:hypothetical protein